MCKGAKADLVFLIDGSWSIGDESFNKVIQFVTSMTGAFDIISPRGMQVSINLGAVFYFLQTIICNVIKDVFAICKWVLLYIILCVLFEQVSFVQYSDDAKTEFKLNTYHDKGIVLSALQTVRYRGGNTKTGSPLSYDTGT